MKYTKEQQRKNFNKDIRIMEKQNNRLHSAFILGIINVSCLFMYFIVAQVKGHEAASILLFLILVASIAPMLIYKLNNNILKKYKGK